MTANEKLSNRQIHQWVQEQLQDAGLPPTTVHPMYCMTHVLLGFHREVTKATSEVQKLFEGDDGKAGRDMAGQFMKYNFENIAFRVVRHVCGVFGPNGDEKRSVGSKWLADCRMRRVKSQIGDYKDNRFNGVFEASAQILHHVDDILALEKKLPAVVNWRVTSAILDLKDSRVVTFLQAYALFFVKVTEPYRHLMTSKDIGYLNLRKYLTSIYLSFKLLVVDPSLLLNTDFTLGMTKPLDTTHTLFETATSIRCPDRIQMLHNLIRAMAGGCAHLMNLQVPEFLPGGALHNPPSSDEVKRTKGSGLNNITVERHFGTLDNSMNRRRHCSFHYHSTILILKSQGKNIINWLVSMPPEKRRSEIKDAMKGGPELREKHREDVAHTHEMEEAALLNEQKLKEEKALRLEKRKANGNSAASSSKKQRVEQREQQLPLPSQAELVTGQLVTVAYENGWYPGVIVDTVDDDIEINFMHATTEGGRFFKWPPRDDVALLPPTFIFKVLLATPVPVSGERQFEMTEQKFTSVSRAYALYKTLYFD